MTHLFVMLAQSVTGNVITIILLNLAAAAAGFLIAWFYARSVYKPVIAGLENDKAGLNNQLAALKDEIHYLKVKMSELEERADALESEIEEKDNEIESLSGKPAPKGKYMVSIAKNGDYYFNLLAANSQPVLMSEMYSSKSSCTNGIESVRKNCDDDNNYERKLSSNNKHYFNLKSPNGQIIGRSEMYETKASMEKGIASVKKNGKSTNVVEE